MADIVDVATRRRMMAGIRGKNTKPELIVRKLLFARGFRYRLHERSLPGRPDLVLKKHRAVIFVHGCFWHCHLCRLFKWPATNVAFWRTKLLRNQEVDSRSTRTLVERGWRVCVIWECALRNLRPDDARAMGDALTEWLRASAPELEISSD